MTRRGENTSCAPVVCGADERVEANACAACEVGGVNEAGDPATGPDTVCELDACTPLFGRTCDRVTSSYLKASNSDELDRFGQSVSLSGDRLAVGAPGEGSCADGVGGDQGDSACRGAGAVYVFERSAAGAWSQFAYLKASNSTDDDSFGSAVSLRGARLAVGAESESSCADGVGGDQNDGACAQAGAVYLFERSPDGVWSQSAYLKASNSGPGDFFGRTISLSDNRLAVGASREDSCADGAGGDQSDDACRNAGAVYVFDRSVSGAWSQPIYLKASNSEASDEFGRSISLSGDRLAVGANGEESCADGSGGDQADNACPSAGAVYLFERSGAGAWSQSAYIKASNSGRFDRFGLTVSLSGERLAVGAPGEDGCADESGNAESNDECSGAGAAYLFERSGDGAWPQSAYLKAPTTVARGAFGESLSISGDRLAVGAGFESSCAVGADGDQSDTACQYAGAAYLFERSAAGVWSRGAYLKTSNPDREDYFGSSLSLSSDLLVVGALGEGSCADGTGGDQADDECAEAGAAYLFSLSP